ncbi:hypothetical protein SAMN05421770_101634 [Granulicella rosea]|uniref:Carboxypeptidase regulatory-like domain-containing protein n=1 Tax=Granulicella rosea TaxID=474952 RepID=A0A239DUZ3_9BACT|nr:hypothetical protein [Granulicella rosea]SNS35572.1 hypothetical protein SAMN05421770_101634 [Granulicella rosea]
MLQRIVRGTLVTSWIFSVCTITAQTQSAPAGQGSITGHVVLSDTNGPARFAHVLIKRIPDGATAKPKANDPESMLAELLGESNDKAVKLGKADPAKKKPEDADTKAAGAAFANIMSSVGDMVASTTVSATGEYTLTGVKPGSYYVHALLPGYIDPLAAFAGDEVNSLDPATQQRIKSAVSVVTITGRDSARLDLRLELGAAISGRVLFEDGSPAAGWKLTAHPVKQDKPKVAAGLGIAEGDIPSMSDMIFQANHMTDDRGDYRLAGLTPGDYIVVATLTASNASAGSAMTGGAMRLAVFSGNVARESDAKPVSVTAHEDRKGVDLVMPLSTLHSLSGKVLAKSDSTPANTGTVQLRDEHETSLLKVQSATIQPDGSFRFDYVPNGDYTLKVRGAQVSEATGGSKKLFGIEIPNTKTLRAFGPDEQKVTLADGDHAGVVFSLPDVPVSKDKDDE